MPLPFLIGGLASIKNKNKKGSVKEAVKKHNGDLEKLRIKESDCTEAMNALEAEKLTALRGLAGIAERTALIRNKPKLDYISFSNVRLLPYDEEELRKVSSEPEWFLKSKRNDAGSYLLETAAPMEITEDAAKAWIQVIEDEKRIYGQFRYYDRLQSLAERYAASIASVRDIYEKHLSVLDQFRQKTGKTDWLDYNETEKFATQNAIQLAVLLLEMCGAELIAEDENKPDTEWINESAVKELMDKAEALCSNKGFEYHGEIYDVILRGDARSYFNYCYRLEDKLGELLPINRDQTAPILEKLRMNSNVSILQEVTQPRARRVLDKLRDIDIKSQRVPSPDKNSVFYIELIKRKEV
ncbi:MAG: hypothetical protein IKP95_11995 [Ruminococcus sp.]|nr:hypothetical protein [Ruminococcus sp.]